MAVNKAALNSAITLVLKEEIARCLKPDWVDQSEDPHQFKGQNGKLITDQIGAAVAKAIVAKFP